MGDDSNDQDAIASSDVGAMLRMIVHDIRNPIATLLANLDVLAEIEPDDPEVPEIVADLRTATVELEEGVRRVGWIGHHMTRATTFDPVAGDVVASIRALEGVSIEAPEGPLLARGGAHAGELAAVLIGCAVRYGRSAEVRVEDGEDGVVVTVSDPGTPVSPADRREVFTLRTQLTAKQDSKLRYAPFFGLPAVAAAVTDLGGEVWADEQDGRAVFAFRLPKD